MARLEQVEELSLQGLSNRKIAVRLDVTEATIRRDLERIGVLMRGRATSDILLLRERSLAQVRLVQREAWETWMWMATASVPRQDEAGAPVNPERQAVIERPKGRPLSIILEGERMVMDLQGTRTPVETPITFPADRKPLEALTSEELLRRGEALRALAQRLLGETPAAVSIETPATPPRG